MTYTLVLLRHGESVWNAENLFTGWVDVDLSDQGGISVQGTFSLGQFVTLTIAYDNGETSTLAVPVVADDGQWAGLDQATPSPTESPSASTSDTSSPSASSS